MKIWSSQSKTDHFFLKWLDYDLTMKQAKNKWLWLDYDWLSQNNDYHISVLCIYNLHNNCNTLVPYNRKFNENKLKN
jgi:hypothetical protein